MITLTILCVVLVSVYLGWWFRGHWERARIEEIDAIEQHLDRIVELADLNAKICKEHQRHPSRWIN